MRYIVVYVHCFQGDGGLSAQEKRVTVTLNRNEITDTEGYSDLPAHSVSLESYLLSSVQM